MSKKNEDGEQREPAEVPDIRAIEEHAAAMKVSAPVFAAVKQSKNWAPGKKVATAEFEKALKDFLNGPMGGV